MVQRPEPESLGDHMRRLEELLGFLSEVNTLTLTADAHDQWSVSTAGLPKDSATRVLSLSALQAACSRRRKIEVEDVDRACVLWKWFEQAITHPVYGGLTRGLYENLDGMASRVQIVMP